MLCMSLNNVNIPQTLLGQWSANIFRSTLKYKICWKLLWEAFTYYVRNLNKFLNLLTLSKTIFSIKNNLCMHLNYYAINWLLCNFAPSPAILQCCMGKCFSYKPSPSIPITEESCLQNFPCRIPGSLQSII